MDQPRILAALRKRYPDLEVLSVTFTRWPDGAVQQNVDYRGPLSAMIRHGLVTDGMIENAGDGRRGHQAMPNGDGFTLFVRDGPDYMAELATFTGDTPRERPRIRTREAALLLRQFTKAATRARSSPAKG